VSLPSARLGPLWTAALAAVVLLWLPLVVIPILDGLLFVSTPRELARDLGLLWLLGMLPAALLALTGWLAARLAGAAGAGGRTRDALGWAVALLPLVWICTWHGARMLWTWTRSVAGLELTITSGLRWFVMGLLLAVLALLIVRLRPASVLARLSGSLLALRPAAALVMLLALGAVLQKPPAVSWRVDPRPAAVERAAPGPRPRPDIVLISIDALAAADADACNPQSVQMPRLAALAQRSSCFTRFYTSSNFTTPTASTMESSLLPWSHFATQPDSKMLPAVRGHSLAAVLRAQGWRTHSITDNLLASPLHRGSFAAWSSSALAHTTLFGNLFRGAMTVFPETALPRLTATALGFLGAFDMAVHGEQSPYASERTYALVLQRLAAEGRSAPQFIWAHTLPPHSPYLPPPSTRHRLLPPGELERWSDMLPDNIEYAPALQPLVDKHRLRYRESIMAADAALGEFLDELQRQGRLDGALIVISADHGESFEQGLIGHAGPRLHDVLIRVPLVLKLPGQQVGRVIGQPVSQADLAPTLLDMAGAPPLPRAEGRSLRALLEGGALPPAPVFSMTMERQSRFRPLSSGRFAVIDGDDKLVSERQPGAPVQDQLFDLRADPGEQRDLAAQRPERVAALRALLDARLGAAEAARLAAQAR